jgi:DNA-directed RNA polymerase subunit beta'
MTQGLSRVEELFEARIPKTTAEISDLDGIISIKHNDNGTVIEIVAETLEEEEYYFDENCEILVKEGQEVKQKQVIARQKKEKQRIFSNFS